MAEWGQKKLTGSLPQDQEEQGGQEEEVAFLMETASPGRRRMARANEKLLQSLFQDKGGVTPAARQRASQIVQGQGGSWGPSAGTTGFSDKWHEMQTLSLAPHLGLLVSKFACFVVRRQPPILSKASKKLLAFTLTLRSPD